MSEQLNDNLEPLFDYSRQSLRVGMPPHFVFDENNHPVDRGLVGLSAELRQATALERIAAALELTNERHYQQQVAATLDTPTGRTVVHAFKERRGKKVNVDMDFSTQEAASTWFESLSEYMKQSVDRENEQEGGPCNG